MSNNNQPKARFFINGDLVKHIPSGKEYIVHSRYGIGEREQVFLSLFDVNVMDMNSGKEFDIPFDELELIESAGVYMGAGLKTPVLNTDEQADKKLQWLKSDVTETEYNNLKPHRQYARINADTWALFGAFGIDTMQLIEIAESSAWVIHYKHTKSQSLEPRFARTFLDRIGLTEDYELRVGNQDEWERFFNREYPNDLDELRDPSIPTPNYPDTPNE